jgi:ABC-type transporter Mla subunit MlaD
MPIRLRRSSRLVTVAVLVALGALVIAAVASAALTQVYSDPGYPYNVAFARSAS